MVDNCRKPSCEPDLVNNLGVCLHVCTGVRRKTDISERKKNLLADLSDYNISVSIMKYRAEFASVK